MTTSPTADGLADRPRRVSWWAAGVILLAAAGAFAFRLPLLDLRPMHTDEAVHAAKLSTLLDSGEYVYDPHEYHGPTPYYFALPILWAHGAASLPDVDENMLRLVPVLFGTGLVLLLLALGRPIGWPAAVCAAVLTAVSPAMVFYSRYYIQEMILVFFTFGLIISGWRWLERPRLGWAIAGGVCLGFMHATKETCILALLAMAGALVLTAGWAWRRDGATPWTWPRVLLEHKAQLALGMLAAALVSATILSGFFTNPRGALDGVLTYANYLGRAAADEARTDGAAHHEHPWHFYLKMLLYTKDGPGPFWSEALIVGLALVGAGVSLFTRRETRRLLQFLTFYTLLMTVGYSIIPYKTPWCMLGFLHGMILLAGVGVEAMVRRLPHWTLQGALCLLLAAATAQLGMQAYRTNFVFQADARNPYVYGHSSSDVVKAGQRAHDIAAVHPAGTDMLVRIMAPGADYWPLPWYLRDFTTVGYWQTPPEDCDAPLIIAMDEIGDAVEARLKDEYMQEFYGLRPEVLIRVYIRWDLWEKFIATRS